MKIATDGYYFIIPGFIIFLLLLIGRLTSGHYLLDYPLLSAFMVTMFFIFFFRDPERKIPAHPGAILSPADGKVIAVNNDIPDYFRQFESKISIFLSIIDVHINRIPMRGKIMQVDYCPGKFHAAFTPKASEKNEHTRIAIVNEYGSLGVCQRAGILARRIVCNLIIGQEVTAGEKFGLIRFGSRVDIYLPPSVRIFSQPGDRVRAGETILGEFVEHES